MMSAKVAINVARACRTAFLFGSVSYSSFASHAHADDLVARCRCVVDVVSFVAIFVDVVSPLANIGDEKGSVALFLADDRVAIILDDDMPFTTCQEDGPLSASNNVSKRLFLGIDG
jgi:hypothetical protein